jgi:hypothetical protein
MLYKVVKKLWSEIFAFRLLEMFWPTLQKPAERWTHGCYGWIQEVRKVKK